LLGSAITTLGAKTLVRVGAPALPTFLFNASFVSTPVEQIKNRQLWQGIRITNSFVTKGMAVVLQRRGGGVHDGERGRRGGGGIHDGERGRRGGGGLR
jgi:hypothetical protein